MTERGFCAHCGLPIRGRCCSPDGQLRFCCYGCYLVHRVIGEQGEEGVAAWLLARFGVGAALAMSVMMISIVLYAEPALGDLGADANRLFVYAMLVLATPSFLLLGIPFVRGALAELRRGTASTDVLVAIGITAAYGVSVLHVFRGGPVYFDTACMLLTLLTLGRLLEATAKTRASRVLRGLLELSAPMARLLTPEGERQVSPESVRPGDRVRVLPGERIPVDGRLANGVTTVDEALFTGESLPQVRRSGDRVFGGTISADGAIVVIAEAVGAGSLLARMVRLVEEAQDRRAPIERQVDRFAALFVPVVLVVAAGAWVFWLRHGDALRGAWASLSVLIVACPCALGLATPLVNALAIGAAARSGVLVRDGETLDLLAHATRVFLDKTGTLTRGQLTVDQILPAPGVSEAEALAWLASLEQESEHPIARALVRAAREAELTLGTVADLRAVPGEGASGRVTLAGREALVLAGTSAFLAQRGVAAADDDEATTTRVHIAVNGARIAVATLRDTVRPEAATAIAGLRELGLSVGVLSGDRRPVAEALARELGLDDVRAECTPDAKVAALRAAREAGERVAMVGDGLNDSPALAEADVGIAMGGATQLAQEAGRVTLVGDDLARLPWLFALAREARRRVTRNLRWSFGYNTFVLAIAFAGWLHPLLAALAMLGSSFYILGNSLAMLRDGGVPGRDGTTAAGDPSRVS